MKTFGDELKRLRAKHHMSQTDLAEMSGIPRSTIRKYEQGTFSRPRTVRRVIELNEGMMDDPEDLQALLDAYHGRPGCYTAAAYLGDILKELGG